MSEDQVGLALRMTGFEEQVCRCGAGSGCLLDVSYDEPPVASGSGLSFRDGGSPSAIPVNLTALDSVSRPKDSSEVPGFRLERVLS